METKTFAYRWAIGPPFFSTMSCHRLGIDIQAARSIFLRQLIPLLSWVIACCRSAKLFKLFPLAGGFFPWGRAESQSLRQWEKLKQLGRPTARDYPGQEWDELPQEMLRAACMSMPTAEAMAGIRRTNRPPTGINGKRTFLFPPRCILKGAQGAVVDQFC